MKQALRMQCLYLCLTIIYRQGGLTAKPACLAVFLFLMPKMSSTILFGKTIKSTVEMFLFIVFAFLLPQCAEFRSVFQDMDRSVQFLLNSTEITDISSHDQS